MARSYVVAMLVLVAIAAVAAAGVEDGPNRKLMQNSRVAQNQRSQQATAGAIKTTVQNAQRGRGSAGNTMAATRTGIVATSVIARPAGPNTVTANVVTRAATPAPTTPARTTPARTTGRHLLQTNRGATTAGRNTASANTASASIKQAVQAANRGGSAPTQTKQATRTGQAAALVIARPAGLPATVTGSAVTTRPATAQPRGM